MLGSRTDRALDPTGADDHQDHVVAATRDTFERLDGIEVTLVASNPPTVP